MNPRSKRRWRYHVVSTTQATKPSTSGPPLSAMTRHSSWWSRRWALVPLVPVLGVLALLVLAPRGATPARAAPDAAATAPVAALVQASLAAHRAEPARRAERPPPGPDDPKAAPRYPEADDVVEVFGEAGSPTRLGDVRAGERVVFRSRLYETRAAPGEQGLEVRPTGLRLERVTRTYTRRSPTLIDLTIRYGDDRAESVLTVTPEHPFFVPARSGYVPMDELAPGTVLQTTDGSEATVAARSERHGDFEVHNLEVEHAHNYFVSPPGANQPGVLVHNATYGGSGPAGGSRPPSNTSSSTLPRTLQVGPSAKGSIPARGPARDFTRAEREALNELGAQHGCHTCGAKSPGTRSNDWIPDHQPPNQLAQPGQPQRLYPHCLACSRQQGGDVNGLLRRQP
jgi:pretoxin HINT domain-containing protein